MGRVEKIKIGDFNSTDTVTVTDGETKDTEQVSFQKILDAMTTVVTNIIIPTLVDGPWKQIVINSLTFYHIKGSGKVALTLEETDKILADEDGQIVVLTYLDANADPNDLDNPLIWDKNAIG